MKKFLLVLMAVCLTFAMISCDKDKGVDTEYVTITKDLNWPDNVVDYDDATAPGNQTITIVKGSGLGEDDLDDPTSAQQPLGFKFLGWFNLADKDDTDAEEIDPDATYSSSTSIYAGWEEVGVVTVTKDLNWPAEAVGTQPDDVEIEITKGYKLPDNALAAPSGASVPSGYSYIRWEDAATDGNEVLATKTYSANATIYAAWFDLNTAPVTVDEEIQYVKVNAGDEDATTVTYIEGGYKVELGGTDPQGYGQFASFKVDLGTGKTIRDFKQVKFTYQAIQGDVGYKPIRLLVSGSAFTSVDPGYDNYAVSASYWGKNAGTDNIICNIGELVGQYSTTYADVDSLTTNEIYVSVYLHANKAGNIGGTGVATTYSVTNIEFVPAPDYVPVSAIVGVSAKSVKTTEVDLTTAFAIPVIATNRDIVWSIKTSNVSGATVGALPSGKFTPTEGGSVTVTATIANGSATDEDYTDDFVIKITGDPEEKEIPLTGVMKGGYTGSLDAGGLGFAVTGGVDYGTTYAVYSLNLDGYTDVTKVTFTFTPVSGDVSFKDLGVYIGTTFTNDKPAAGNKVGQASTGSVTAGTGKPLEITVTLAAAIPEDGNVQIGFNLPAATTCNDTNNGNTIGTTAFNISDIKFWVIE